MDPYLIKQEKPPQIRSPIDEDSPGRKQKTRNVQQPGEYVISKCELKSPNIAVAHPVAPAPSAPTSAGVNIIPLLGTVHIYEDISKPYLLADFEIRDGMGLREQIPIIGEEYITFEASTLNFTAGENEPDNPLDGIVKKTFRVYTTSSIIDNSPTLKTYILHCISCEAIVSEKRKISRGYSDAKIERVVADIYENYIAKPISTFYSDYVEEGPKKFIIEPTEDTFNFCFPFKSPFDIIEDLAEKAIPAPATGDEGGFENAGAEEEAVEEDQPSDGALYMFYETLSYFKFESVETSFKRQPKRHFVSTVSTEHNPDESQMKVHVAGQLNNAEEYTVESLFDVVQNMREGMYASKLITHDMIRMRYDQIGYRYIEQKDILAMEAVRDAADGQTPINGKTPDLDTSKKRLIDLTRQLGAGKLCSYNHDCLLDDASGEGSLVRFTGTDQNHAYFLAMNRKGLGSEGGYEPNIKEANKEARIQKRGSQLQQLDNIRITIKVSGDSSLRVGDIVEWHMPSQISNAIHHGNDDFFLGGKYIITKIKHSFSVQKYIQEIQLRKDSLHNWAPSAKVENIVMTRNPHTDTTHTIPDEAIEGYGARQEPLAQQKLSVNADVQAGEERTSSAYGPFYDGADNVLAEDDFMNPRDPDTNQPTGIEGSAWGREPGWAEINESAGVTRDNVNRNL